MHFLSILFRHQWLIVAFSLMAMGNAADVIDIACHDTYFVIDGFQAGLLGTLLFGVLWSLHRFIAACRTVKWLSAFHLLATSVAGVWLWAIVLLTVPAQPRRYTDYSVYNDFSHTQPMDPTVVLSWLVVMFVGLQVIFLIQVGIGIAVKMKKRA